MERPPELERTGAVLIRRHFAGVGSGAYFICLRTPRASIPEHPHRANNFVTDHRGRYRGRGASVRRDSRSKSGAAGVRDATLSRERAAG
jgi:hypothetical protein